MVEQYWRAFNSMVLGPSRGRCAEVIFPKTEGEKFCRQSIGNKLANLVNVVAAISYDSLALF